MTTTTSLAWTRTKNGWGNTEHRATLADGTRVTIRATGQRNGRVLGGAWAATIGAHRVASGGTLTACKAAVERLAGGTL